jgi:hypothetical protein
MTKINNKVDANTKEIKSTNIRVDGVEDTVAKLNKKLDDMEKKLGEEVYEEMRERDQRRLNLVLHDVKEPARSITDGRDRIEADKMECMNIFKAAGSDIRKKDIKFCRRIGARGEDPRPLLIGVRTEDDKRSLLECAKELQKTGYKNVHIGPDLTKKQRKEEGNLMDEAERRNKEELTLDDKAKNLAWVVVGAKGERRLIKSVMREEREGRKGENTHRQNRIGREMDRRDNRMEGTGARRKKSFSKRNRSISTDSDMEQDQPARTRTRK